MVVLPVMDLWGKQLFFSIQLTTQSYKHKTYMEFHHFQCRLLSDIHPPNNEGLWQFLELTQVKARLVFQVRRKAAFSWMGASVLAAWWVRGGYSQWSVDGVYLAFVSNAQTITPSSIVHTQTQALSPTTPRLFFSFTGISCHTLEKTPL